MVGFLPSSMRSLIFRHKAFPDAEQLQDAGHDDLADPHLLPQVGENGVLHEVAHLVRTPGMRRCLSSALDE